METTCDFLDAVKQRLALPSDYALAPVLGVTRSQVSRYRNRHDVLSDEVAMKVSTLLEARPAYVLACVAAERTKSGPARAAWTEAAEALCIM